MLSDAERFKAIVLDQINQGHLVHGVRTYSPGGDAYAALSIGRQIRTLGLMTSAPLKDPNRGNVCNYSSADLFNADTAHTGPDCVCDSACSLIWMAGSSRHGSQVGIHALRYDRAWFRNLTPSQAHEAYAEGVEQVRVYFKELGDVPDWTLQRMLDYNSDTIHILSDDELAQFSNHDPSLDELAIARCGPFPPRDATTGHGGIYRNGPRKRFMDCIEPLIEANLKDKVPRYLALYGPPTRTSVELPKPAPAPAPTQPAPIVQPAPVKPVEKPKKPAAISRDCHIKTKTGSIIDLDCLYE